MVFGAARMLRSQTSLFGLLLFLIDANRDSLYEQSGKIFQDKDLYKLAATGIASFSFLVDVKHYKCLSKLIFDGRR